MLRNYLVQTAIEKAQQKDFSEIDRLLTLLQNPYSDQPGMNAYAAPPPNWGKHLAVSCSLVDTTLFRHSLCFDSLDSVPSVGVARLTVLGGFVERPPLFSSLEFRTEGKAVCSV